MGGLKPGDDLIYVGWAGLDGSAVLANERGEYLKKSLPDDMIKRVSEYFSGMSDMSVCKNIAEEVGFSDIFLPGEGGVFGALWDMGAASGVGFTVDLKMIPIKQETIEICEVFDINPYLLRSGGSMLIGTAKGSLLSDRFRDEAIDAAVIGYVTDNADRIVRNGEGRRFLEPRHPDELDRALSIEV